MPGLMGLPGAILLLLGACSQLTPRDEPAEAERHTTAGFPNLASVPAKPPETSTRPQIVRLGASLRADRAKAAARGDRSMTPAESLATSMAANGGLVAVIHFDTASTRLSAEDETLLEALAALQRERGGAIRLRGYASRGGVAGEVLEQRLANLELSYRRAAAVAALLTVLGVPEGGITVEGRGEAESALPESLADRDVAARRV